MGGVIGAGIIGAGMFFGSKAAGRRVAGGVSHGGAQISESILNAADILAKAGLEATSIATKEITLKFAQSMTAFNGALDITITKNVQDILVHFDYNVLNMMENVDKNVDSLIKAFGNESQNWLTFGSEFKNNLRGDFMLAFIISISLCVGGFLLLLFMMSSNWLNEEEKQYVKSFVTLKIREIRGFWDQSFGTVVFTLLYYYSFLLVALWCCDVLIKNSLDQELMRIHLDVMSMQLKLTAKEHLSLIQAIASVPIGTLLAFSGDDPAMKKLRSTGRWALCDGTSPEKQGIHHSLYTSTPDLTKGVYLKGVGEKDEKVTSLGMVPKLMLSSVAVTTEYTHTATIPSNGMNLPESDQHLLYSGAWGHNNNGHASGINFHWDKPGFEVPNHAVVYIILVK